MADSSTATVDTVQLTGAGTQNGKTLTLNASCELMHNQLPASAIDPSHNILAAQDSSGAPLIFSIGSDDQLWLLRTDPDTPGGWSGTELSAGMDAYGKTLAFDLSQDVSGRISLAAAMLRKDGSGTDVLYATLLSADLTQTDWSKFATLAKPVAGIDPAFTASRLILGYSDDDAAPLLSVAGVIGVQQHYYVLTDVTKPATRMEFPEDLGKDPTALIEMANGYAFGQRGIWFLYGLGDSQTLECTTFATDDLGPMMYDYSPGYKNLIPKDMRYTCMALPTGGDPGDIDPFSISSDVYVGTKDGVYLFRGAHAAAPEPVATNLTDVRQIVVRTQGDKVSVWAMCSPSQLWYIAGTTNQPNSWKAPILFSNDCIHVAPIRSSANKANELFCVTTDLSLAHAIQDPVSTLWQQSTIKVATKKYLFNVETYTSALVFTDDAGNPLAGMTVDMTSSDWVYATVNGRKISLDTDAPAQLTTDTAGKITVIVPASDISTPILHVTADSFAETANVYPNGRVHQQLRAIKSGADLKAATAQGQPVVDPDMSDDTANGVASNIGQIGDAADQSIQGTRPPGAVYVALDGVKHTGALTMADIPHNFAVGMSLQGGSWQPHPASAALASVSAVSLSASDVVDDIVDGVGDALHWLEHTFEDGLKAIMQGVTILEDGASFVLHKVEEGLQFVLTIAGKVFKLVLKTLGALFKVLNFILKLIGIDLRKILAWLGHLLGWDKIWDTHKRIAALINGGLDYGNRAAQAKLPEIRNIVTNALTTARNNLDAIVLPAAIAQQRIQRQPDGAPAGVQHSAPANMAGYQVQHGGLLDGTSGDGPGGPNSLDGLVGLIPSLLETVFDDMAQLVEDTTKLLSDPTHTLDTVREILADLIDLILDPVIKLVGAVFDVVEALVDIIVNAIKEDLDIPFLSDLYEFITDLLGDGEDFTVVNGMSLLLAIPIVEMARAFDVPIPFDGDDSVMAPDYFDTVMGPQPAPVAASLAAVRAAPKAMPGLAAMPMASVADAPVPTPTPTPTPTPSDDDDGVSASDHNYSVAGGMMGAGCAIIENICMGLAQLGVADTVGGKRKFEICVMTMAIFRFCVTFPIRDNKMEDSVYGLKVTGWVVALIGNIVPLGMHLYEARHAAAGDAYTPFDQEGGASRTDKIEGAVGAITAGITMLLVLISDGIDKEDNVLQWSTDVLSGLGGMGQGVGTASKNGWVFAAGIVAGWAGSVTGIFRATQIAAGDVGHFVNVGG